MDGIDLPAKWQFLGGWWIVLHLVALALVFLMGYAIGRSSATPHDPGEWDWGDEHALQPPDAPAAEERSAGENVSKQLKEST